MTPQIEITHTNLIIHKVTLEHEHVTSGRRPAAEDCEIGAGIGSCPNLKCLCSLLLFGVDGNFHISFLNIASCQGRSFVGRNREVLCMHARPGAASTHKA